MRNRIHRPLAALDLFLTSSSSHGVRAPIRQQPCLLRQFATTPIACAGHNKWSKTKHIKAVTDRKKMNERVAFTKAITLYSKLYGDDVRFNPQLANAVSAASKASVPKSLIDAAIARGQGRSTTGSQLEPITLEALVPPNVAILVEAETDNKNRTLGDLRLVVKDCGALSSSTAFYFTKRGRAVFKQKEGGPSLSDILEEAIEHEGVEDVEELPDGGFLVWTEPALLTTITEAFGRKLDLEIVESDIVFDPNEETRVQIDSSETAETLENLFSGLREYTEVKGVYANIRQGAISDDEWSRINRHLDV